MGNATPRAASGSVTDPTCPSVWLDAGIAYHLCPPLKFAADVRAKFFRPHVGDLHSERLKAPPDVRRGGSLRELRVQARNGISGCSGRREETQPVANLDPVAQLDERRQIGVRGKA